MDRRKFLGGLIGGVAASAAVRAWPFRVFSFPSEIDKPWARIVEPYTFQYPIIGNIYFMSPKDMYAGSIPNWKFVGKVTEVTFTSAQ